MKKLSYYTDEHNNFCMKLVRNFGHFSNNHEFLYHKTERCYDLNNWIYYSMKKYKISKEIITGCFDDYKFYMNNIGKEPLCIDYEYDNIYDDQIRIIKLKIFQSYMEIVKNIIIGNGPINNDLQNYVCECVKIYKELKNHYCPNGDTHHINGKDTCKMLNTLKNTYMSFIYNKSQKNYKIPSLNNVEIEYLAMCPQDNNRSELTSESHGISSESASLNGVRDGGTVGISSHGRGINDEANLFTSSTYDNVENKGSPMSRTVSTAVGTVAGASSILALLYKVNKEFYLNV
ncbi:hypothetical protein PVIIG_05606 [Plasmodium vivax India VII]|uniref:Uncharacterized protein n=1 Tax=Plasmodium vivax India VII TaxID=1077284 RepID=A0A0J9UTJ4_PLAVI|nr:hypothetical protein PVIIG_05606 [Plasmodium vivax India VII]